MLIIYRSVIFQFGALIQVDQVMDTAPLLYHGLYSRNM